MPEYKLPDVGEGLTEAEIVSWKVKVGDVVAVNDIVVEIETAKSLVELPSPYAGEVTALLVAEGETVAVGTAIIAIGLPVPAAAPPAVPEVPVEIDLSNPAASGGAEGETLVGRAKAEGGAVRRSRVSRLASLAPQPPAGLASLAPQPPAGLASLAPQPPAGLASLAPQPPAGLASLAPQPAVSPLVEVRGAPATSLETRRALAKPPVRKLAKELGIDLAEVDPTGPEGTVTRADVEAAARVAPAASTPGSGGLDLVAGERETREPVKGVRKAMAGAMVSSAFTAPHVTEWVQVDATRTLELVERLKGRREFREVKVSPLLVLARAVMLAMRRTPIINSTWTDTEVILKHYVNLGIAAATPRGLVVPNIKDADQLALPDLAAALDGLVATAREGRTPPEAMAGGTFTITNVGVFGVDGGTPIINPGESAILCFGQIADRPWVVDGELAVRKVGTLTLSFDHRHVDGEAGSRFLADVASILEDPATALVF